MRARCQEFVAKIVQNLLRNSSRIHSRRCVVPHPWLWSWDRTNPEKLDQCHDYWCPGSLRSIRGRISTTYAISMMTSSNRTFSALLAFCAVNSPITGDFPSQRPVTRSFDVFFDLRLNKCLSKQSRRRWFGRPSRSWWRRVNVFWEMIENPSMRLCLLSYIQHPKDQPI